MPKKTPAVLLALLALAAAQQLVADSLPLFHSDDTLAVVIEVPMKRLRKEAKQKPQIPGYLSYVDASGQEVRIAIELTTRGKSRLEYCRFPPLSITVNHEQARSTLFAGQEKLKIGTQCRTGAKYLDYLEQEFGIYKAFNLLTDHSFRVRKLAITYRDSERSGKDEVQPGFFIESEHEAAERLGLARISSPRIRVSQLDARQTSISGLFQYLIANTDWDITKGPGDEDCCHNGKLLGPPGTEENWVVLPYDFDQAGLINTEYAMPAPALGIRTVRTRVYRGECRFQDQLAGTIELFNARRDGLESALAPEALSPSTRRNSLKYIEEFYAIINDAGKLEQKISSACLKG